MTKAGGLEDFFDFGEIKEGGACGCGKGRGGGEFVRELQTLERGSKHRGTGDRWREEEGCESRDSRDSKLMLDVHGLNRAKEGIGER